MGNFNKHEMYLFLYIQKDPFNQADMSSAIKTEIWNFKRQRIH